MDVFGSRLRQARKRARLSLRGLAEKVGVSQTSILKYEQGQMAPASDLLIRLAAAVGLPVDHLFRPYAVALAKVRYRRLAPFGEKTFASIEAQVADQLERRLELESLVSVPPPRFDRPALSGGPEEMAQALRLVWDLGSHPIHHLVDLCEERGIRVIAVEEQQFDGLFGEAGDLPILVISRSWPGDRQRFTLAHELGHLLGIEEESACNRFAGAFLFPKEAVIRWFGPMRSRFEWREFQLAKWEYGISMQAICHRLREVGLASDDLHRRWALEFRRRGWRECEPGEQIPAEPAFAFERMLFSALGEGEIGESKAAELLGVSIEELRSDR